MYFSADGIEVYLGDKRSRVNIRMLFTTQLKGVLGVPDLTKHFYAAQLAQLIHFHSQSINCLWMRMESPHLLSTLISHLMWLKARDRPGILCPTFSFSLGLWDRLAKRYGFKSPHTPNGLFVGQSNVPSWS